MAEFAIYDVAAGGGMIGIARMPREMDLAVIRRWAPALVVSMTPPQEMAAAAAADLTAAGGAWHCVGVADFGVPDAAAEVAWAQTAQAAKAVLAEGGRVLLHCMGGCGRSGMGALRLMVDAGEDADAALRRLRAVRPCAVETDAQFDWAARAVR